MSHIPLSKKMFPVSLLLEGRRCLIVGGGRVAARKGTKLAAAGADLTVVAPSIRQQIRAVSGIQLIERPFQDSDLEGAFIVFALTDDSALNRRIVDLCRQKGILCSVADANWPDGDLILPASFQDDGLTVAVSTAGRACRRSRMLRESLSRHVEFLQGMDLFIFGSDLNRLDASVLEQLKTARADIESALTGLRGVHEFIILDTCNRFEILGLFSGGTTTEMLLRRIIGIGHDLHFIRGFDAFARFAETAAGLHSQALGENRIVAQIKEALAFAQEKQHAASFMQSWTDIILCISKEIRQETGPLLPALETEDLVVQWLKQNYPTTGSILIIGRGEIGQGLARQFPAAVQISGRSGKEIKEQLPRVDLIICATGSETFLIDESHRSLLRNGTILIDVSLPRNINPSLPGVIGLSDLRAEFRSDNFEQIQTVSRHIITRHADDYDRLIQFKKKEHSA